jgi:drug/metabolite transporter (DMT)-like permease
MMYSIQLKVTRAMTSIQIQRPMASSQRGVGALAIMMVVVSSIAIGIAPIFAKLAYEGGSNAYSVITARNLMMTVILGAGLLSFGRSFRLPRQALIMSLAMGPVYILLSFGYLGAVAYIPVNLTILIYFLHPLFIGFLVRFMGHEAVSGIRIGALCLAIIGLGIAIGSKWLHLNPIGLGLAFMSAIACTVMIVGNSITMKKADSILVIFYMVLSATVILGATHLFCGRYVWPGSLSGWTGFIGVGVSYTVGITLFFAAIPMIGAARASMVSNIEPIIGIAFSMLILGESVSGVQVGGMLLVFLSIILMETAN